MLRTPQLIAAAIAISFVFFTASHLSVEGLHNYLYFRPYPTKHTSITKPLSQEVTMPSPITHIVLFQFKSETSPEDVKAAIDAMTALKDNCIHPTTQKPYIVSLKGGKDNSPEGLQGGITHAFVVELASEEDRKYYFEEDPAHQAFIKGYAPLCEKVVVVDFKAGVY